MYSENHRQLRRFQKSFAIPIIFIRAKLEPRHFASNKITVISAATKIYYSNSDMALIANIRFISEPIGSANIMTLRELSQAAGAVSGYEYLIKLEKSVL